MSPETDLHSPCFVRIRPLATKAPRSSRVTEEQMTITMAIYYKKLSLWHEVAKFQAGAEWLDTSSVKRPRQDSKSESKSDSHEAQTPLKSRLDLWAEQGHVANTFKLLHRLLKHIENAAENEASQGNPKFLLRQLRKTSEEVDVIRSTKFGHLTVDLISPRMINELKAAGKKEDDDNDDDEEEEEDDDDDDDDDDYDDYEEEEEEEKQGEAQVEENRQDEEESKEWNKGQGEDYAKVRDERLRNWLADTQEY
ncbi:hypothetical protein F4818DRAFT_454619 [Hypoxylon cercidicola]|nr:hypothetical protein F4818DRAFT_454619 [Hypoxylon cercidicola]